MGVSPSNLQEIDSRIQILYKYIFKNKNGSRHDNKTTKKQKYVTGVRVIRVQLCFQNQSVDFLRSPSKVKAKKKLRHQRLVLPPTFKFTRNFLIFLLH